MFKYSTEQLSWLSVNYPLLGRNELTVVFNKYFSTDTTVNSIRDCLRNHKIKSGRTGHFKKGFMSANPTSFKKGDIPHNKKKLWTEKVNDCGYTLILVPEINLSSGGRGRFKFKHVWLWENKNGLVPKGSVVIFKDGDRKNLKGSNLILVTKAELLVLNYHGYKDAPKEIKPSLLTLSKIEVKGGFRARSVRGQIEARRATNNEES